MGLLRHQNTDRYGTVKLKKVSKILIHMLIFLNTLGQSVIWLNFMAK